MLVLFLANPVVAVSLFGTSIRQEICGSIRLRPQRRPHCRPGGSFRGLTLERGRAGPSAPNGSPYLLFPALAIAVFRLTGTVLRTAAFLCVTLAAFCLVGRGTQPIRPWATSASCSASRAALSSSRSAFALFRLDQGRERSRVETACALGLAVITGTAFVLLQPADFFLMPLTFAALIYGLSDERGLLPRLLRNPALQWLGVVSYSTYLSHYFLKIWTKFILVRPGISPDLPFPAYVCAVLVASGAPLPSGRTARATAG